MARDTNACTRSRVLLLTTSSGHIATDIASSLAQMFLLHPNDTVCSRDLN